MSITDRAAVAELDLLRSAINPRRADAEPQIDALIAKMRIGPQRQAVDFHFALEKRLRQRRALIGRILLRGEKNDLAVKPLFAQARRGLNAGVSGADDNDRGRRHGQAQAFARPLALSEPSFETRASGSVPQDEEVIHPTDLIH